MENQAEQNGNERVILRNTLRLFKDIYDGLLFKDMYKGILFKDMYDGRPEIAAKNMIASGNAINREKRIGHVQGFKIGDQFLFRAELVVVGLHSDFISGIDWMIHNGNIHATSIVDGGRYENEMKSDDVFIFCGQGGKNHSSGKRKDQKMHKGNLALLHSMINKESVRVIRKCDNVRKINGPSLLNDRGDSAYIYHGLYRVEDYENVPDQEGYLVFKFELHRISGQQRLPRHCRRHLNNPWRDCCLVRDISEGKERWPVSVMNGIDYERPRAFSYLPSSKLSDDLCMKKNHPRINDVMGCNSTNNSSCSGLVHCQCTSKHGDYIGQELPLIYECGITCKCSSSSCKNRETQKGLGYKLEIFKTQTGEWGVRSRSFISSGAFICECSGVLEKNDETSTTHAFTINAAVKGNVARFVRISEQPNALLKVVYNNIPRLTIFAAKDITPFTEIAYGPNCLDRNGAFKWNL